MTWQLTDKGKRVEPLPGVPWREMSDEEFQQAAAEYATSNGFAATALATSGFFQKVTPRTVKESNDG